MGAGRVHEREFAARLDHADDGSVQLRSPGVGFFRGLPPIGAVVTPAEILGELETLDRLVRVRVPGGAVGRIVSRASPELARVPVGWDELLVTLDPEALAAAAVAEDEAKTAEASGLVVKAPSSGRFYVRPGPGEEPFVQVGTELSVGQTVCLLEVMKTFNRVLYGGDGLPARARVVEVVPDDDSDVDAGDVILRLEPV